MASATIARKNTPARLDGDVILTLSPEEAHAVMLVLGDLAGPKATTVLQYTDAVYDAIESATGFPVFTGVLNFHDSALAEARQLTSTELAQLGVPE